jgi:predicted metalloprotease with PDZ domain
VPSSITYTLRFVAATQHYVEVEAAFPPTGATDGAGLALRLAVWTPGSYMVREYARHIEALQAFGPDEAPLAVQRTRKNRWHVACDGQMQVRIRYRVYAREMTVRTNWVDRDFALLNGAPTFISGVDMAQVPHVVRVEPPPNWSHVIVALPQTRAGDAYVAADYDTLVDTPWFLGNFDLRAFDAAGKPHLLASVGGEGAFDHPRAATDTARIVAEHHALWGTAPYSNYVFMNVLTDGRGGLEHKDSSVLMASPHATASRADYIDWLGLVSHEFFHVWNIKRLRPVALGPFDYEAEVPTPSLWVAEGLTAYYDDLQVCRAQLCTPTEYLARLSRAIQAVQTSPGRQVQTLAEASYDAWIKFYRRDENTDNTAVSYYLKGSLVGFILDAMIRQTSAGARSLDDVMRLAYTRFSGKTGYTEEGFRDTAAEVAGTDLGTFFRRAVDSTAELDFAPALALYGLRFTAAPGAADVSKGRPDGWLGVATRTESGRLVVSQVPRHTPAYAAGLNVDDELIAWNGFRVQASKFVERVRQTPCGTEVPVVVARRERLLTLGVTVQATPHPQWHLAVDDGANAAQRAARESWLSTNHRG